MWRAIRYGLDGRLLDLEAPIGSRSSPPARRSTGCAPGRAPTSRCPSSTAPSASARMIDAGAGPAEVYAECLRETQATYSEETVR